MPARKPGLATVTIGVETVIYSPDSDALHRLDRTASIVWSQLTGDNSVAALAADFAAVYRADSGTVLDDLLALVTGFWRRGLLDGSTADAEFTGRDRRAVRKGLVADLPTAVDGKLPAAPHRTPACRALGHRFSVASNMTAVRDYLQFILCDLADSGTGSTTSYEVLAIEDTTYVLRYQGEVIAAVDRTDRALSLLLWHINMQAAQAAAMYDPVVHAAAAVRSGVTVLMPAPQESGKTTTVAGLVRAGFGYLSDEAVAIDRNSLLPRAYPKPLSIDSGSWDILAELRPRYSDQMVGQWQVPATSIRGDALAEPAPIRFVVIPAYERDADTRLERMSRPETLVALADSTFHFWDAPQRNLDILAGMLHSTSCFRLTLSDLNHGIRLVEDLVGSEQLDVTE